MIPVTAVRKMEHTTFGMTATGGGGGTTFRGLRVKSHLSMADTTRSSSTSRYFCVTATSECRRLRCYASKAAVRLVVNVSTKLVNAVTCASVTWKMTPSLSLQFRCTMS